MEAFHIWWLSGGWLWIGGLICIGYAILMWKIGTAIASLDKFYRETKPKEDD